MDIKIKQSVIFLKITRLYNFWKEYKKTGIKNLSILEAIQKEDQVHSEHFSTCKKNSSRGIKKNHKFLTRQMLKWRLKAKTDKQKEVRAGSKVYDVLCPVTGPLQATHLQRACTSSSAFESAPMTALQSSSVVLIRWLQSSSSQQHNAAEQARTAHGHRRCRLSRTTRPLSFTFPGENEMLMVKTTLW